MYIRADACGMYVRLTPTACMDSPYPLCPLFHNAQCLKKHPFGIMQAYSAGVFLFMLVLLHKTGDMFNPQD
jgi:hypothetical protein